MFQAINQPKPGNEDNTKLTIRSALRKLFDTMTNTNDVVSARELTQSFGWDSRQLNEAQDATEMLRVLLYRLKNDSPDPIFPFSGALKLTRDVEQFGVRVESFWGW